MNVGERIRRLREDAGLSRAELGRRIGVSGAAVGQWEKQANGVRPSNVEKVAEVLGKPLEIFYSDSHVPASAAPLSDEDMVVSAMDFALRSTGVSLQPAQVVRMKMLALEYLRRTRG
jgi:transcriptional regulator with XRE-family HTH domain